MGCEKIVQNGQTEDLQGVAMQALARRLILVRREAKFVHSANEKSAKCRFFLLNFN